MDVVFADVHDLAAGLRVFLLLQGALVEIVNQRRAMVLLDDVDDLAIQIVLEREIHAFFHMRHDDQRAHRGREIVMRIALEVHVLGEVIRLHQFADIVEIGTNAAERGVRADRFRGRFREVRDHQAVVIGARRFDRHPPQERMVQIRGLQPGNVGRDAEEMFQDREQPADDCGHDNAVADGERALHAEHLPIVRARGEKIDWPDETEGERRKPDGDAHAQSRPNQPAAFADLQRQINRGETADEGAGKKRRVKTAEKKPRPKTDEDGRV